MPAPVNRSQLRKEMHRSGFVGNIPVDEAVSVVLRRTASTNYSLAVTDASATSAAATQHDEIKTLLTTMVNLLTDIKNNTAPEA